MASTYYAQVKSLFTNNLFVRVDEISALGIMRGGPLNAAATIGGATFSVNNGQFEFQVGAAMEARSVWHNAVKGKLRGKWFDVERQYRSNTHYWQKIWQRG